MILLRYGLSIHFFHSHILLQTLLLILFPLHSDFIFSSAILVVTSSHFGNLICFSFGLLNFLPSFLFFKLKQSNSISKKFGILSCLLFILSSGNKSACDLLFIIILLLIAILIVILHLLLLFLHHLHLLFF